MAHPFRHFQINAQSYTNIKTLLKKLNRLAQIISSSFMFTTRYIYTFFSIIRRLVECYFTYMNSSKTQNALMAVSIINTKERRQVTYRLCLQPTIADELTVSVPSDDLWSAPSYLPAPEVISLCLPPQSL